MTATARHDIFACKGAFKLKRYFTPDGKRLYSNQVRRLKNLETGSRPRTQAGMRSLIALQEKGVIDVDFEMVRNAAGDLVPCQGHRTIARKKIKILIPFRKLRMEEYDAE